MNSEKMVAGKTLLQWRQEYPIMDCIAALEESAWINPEKELFQEAIARCPLSYADVQDASDRLDRFAAYFRKAFPETAAAGGILESPLRQIPRMQTALEGKFGGPIPGKLWIKLDSHLPISGSIKARGGIYEVLYTAEQIALQNGMLKPGDSYEVFDSPEMKALLSKYSIAVGSTGNLGLSIGIMSAKLGFRVTVHMSADARQWKKDMLRSKGVTVVEYESDYSIAVAEGRKRAQDDPYCHFVDDEGSVDLFLGYAVAALRIGAQFEDAGITVDENHPLFVYIPCGVGGAPGGVTFGLKQIYGDNVHVFFAEPTHAPCMTLGLITGLHDGISCRDIGIDGITDADGLAVGRASYLVSSFMQTLLDGCYTIDDEKLYPFLTQLADREKIYIEPSSCASFTGPALVSAAAEYLEAKGLTDKMQNASHILWATGGSMVPDGEMKLYYERGK